MSDIRKRKSKPQDKNQVSSSTHSEPTQEKTGTPVNAWSIFGRACAIAGIVFAAGFILTLIASSVYGVKDLPHKGMIQYGDDKTPSFFAYYPAMRKFAILDDPLKPGTESQFTRIGTLGTGFFLYTVMNTFHWIMEMGFSSLGGMIVIPIVVLVVGSAVFFFKMLPYSMQKPDTALTVGIGISMLHALIVLIFFLLLLQVSPLFNSLFRGPYFYSGDVIMTTTRAGIPILLITGFAYGTIAGGILYALVSVREILLGKRPVTGIHQAH